MQLNAVAGLGKFDLVGVALFVDLTVDRENVGSLSRPRASSSL